MPSSENRVIIACAGSGKTTRLVNAALVNRDRRIAIITYTNNNTRQIIKRFGELNSGVPKHVEVMTWLAFLLQECARPYQRLKYADKRIDSLLFANQQSARGTPETDTRRYYFANGDLIYSDKIARFVVECEEKSKQSVTARLRQIFTDVFIDECQDLAGWDFDLIKCLLKSGIRVTLVGDPRQHTYSTNPSSKNKSKSKTNTGTDSDSVKQMQKWHGDGLCTIETMTGTYRCNGPICEFANSLWPGMEPMKTLRNDTTDHDGIFLVAESAVHDYVQRYCPQVLRYDKRTATFGHDALNFGSAKGLEFARVLIVPTGPIRKYLQSGDLSHVEPSKNKLHVAVTRARHSVAFVCDDHSPIVSGRFIR